MGQHFALSHARRKRKFRYCPGATADYTGRMNRRQFLKNTAILGAGLATWRVASLNGADAPSKKIIVGVMSCSGRGKSHMQALLANPSVEIAYVCDVDSRRLAEGAQEVAKKQGKEPKAVKDFRRILDDRDVDALTVATPNHWHAPATILACAAGKHVYVEKPCSHNPHEGEMMIAAARQHKRIVQAGTQRRSWPGIIEAVEKLRAGAIGKVRLARCWYDASRGSIGRGKTVPAPEWLDYALWQGPAPERPYKDNLIHYNWHWLWHWGNGELGNNGIHFLDLARWGLGVDYPRRVTCGGGRYYFDDDQETPDTYIAHFDFGHCGISWESHSCHPRKQEGELCGLSFFGESATLLITSAGYRIEDLNGKLVQEGKGGGSDAVHFANFLYCIRGGQPPNAAIDDAEKSTLLCHLGNIAYRTGHAIHLDPQTHQIVGDPEAARCLWQREYRDGWEPKV